MYYKIIKKINDEYYQDSSPRHRYRSHWSRYRSQSLYEYSRLSRQESFIDEQFYPYSQFHNLVSPRYFQAPINGNHILNSKYPLPRGENYFIDNQENRP